FIDKFCIRKMDAVIWVNFDHSLKRDETFLKRTKSFIVENGIPEINFHRTSLTQKNKNIREFCKKGFVIGAIGRLSEEKGHIYLIEAMASLLAKKGEHKLIIIGAGELKTYFEKVIEENGIKEKVLLTGYIENAFDNLPLFDVFVLPSLTEGLPIALLEAMQAEIPIVATKVGGIPGVLENGQCGLLVNPGISKELKNAIKFVRQNPINSKKMANRAKYIALNKFSSQRMALNYAKIYKSILL
ncbi:glycosyltransferase family 4 protein, partial [Thermodesulfobacteriota bacterium]